MTTAKSKAEYIKAWDEHINDFNILAFVDDRELHERVVECQRELMNAVRAIADKKGLQ